MDIHGFLMYSEMELLSHEDTKLVLGLHSSSDTKKQYPFDFSLEIQWELKGEKVEDYELDFGKEATPVRVGMSEDCFVTGEDTAFPLGESGVLKLHHHLFDDDAIILREIPERVILKSAKGQASVTVEFPDMKYLGIWHWPKTEVDYVCIEPWTSLPSRKGVVEALEEQENLISLMPGCEYKNRWSIAVKAAE